MARDPLALTVAAAALAVALNQAPPAPVAAPAPWPAPVAAPAPWPAPVLAPVPHNPGPVRRTLTAVIDAADRILPYR
jgi:hypothetical protein